MRENINHLSAKEEALLVITIWKHVSVMTGRYLGQERLNAEIQFVAT